VVEALQALRGVQCTVAVTPGAERGDLTRFATPRELMTFLGLIPSEDSTGERRRQGSITKAGNTPARRALVEGAWASRYPAQGSRPLQLRLAPLKAIQDISWKAQVRLCKRSRKLIARGQHANQVVVALARELMGCMGAIAKAIPVTPSAPQTEHEQPATQQVSCGHWQRRRPGAGYPSPVCRDPLSILGPRVRQAPDGGTEGGTQPTESSRSTRRVFRAPPLPMPAGQNT
jgi:hypothetical protein